MPQGITALTRTTAPRNQGNSRHAYVVRDHKTGKVLCRGYSAEVSKRLKMDQKNVASYANRDTLLKGKYKIEREAW